VLWTNAIAECPSDSFKNVPSIIWGNGGGHLKQGSYVDAGGKANSPLLNALITAAIQDTGETMENFGAGREGQLAAVLSGVVEWIAATAHVGASQMRQSRTDGAAHLASVMAGRHLAANNPPPRQPAVAPGRWLRAGRARLPSSHRS